MRLSIEKLVYGGAGLARTPDGVVFVPRTAAGDVVEAEIVTRKKDFATAQLTQILEPSPDRQEPICAAGCCHWGHIRYEKQVEYKESILRESLQRLGHIKWDGPIQRITGPDRNYRLRATFHVVNGQPGFMQEKTNTVIPTRECASLVPEINQFMANLDAAEMREVHVVSGPAIAAKFVMQNGEIRRSGRATIHVDGLQYRLAPDTFFQANRFLLAPLITEVLGQSGPSPTHVLELFAGSGFFSIPLARVAKEIIAVESDRAAIKQGRENATLNGVWQLRFFEGQVDATLRDAGLKPEVVVVDPPRAGCGAKVMTRIAQMAPSRIVYVSCNPTTFAPDAAALIQHGYELRRLTLVDQFPNTYHVEIVALFYHLAKPFRSLAGLHRNDFVNGMINEQGAEVAYGTEMIDASYPAMAGSRLDRRQIAENPVFLGIYIRAKIPLDQPNVSVRADNENVVGVVTQRLPTLVVNSQRTSISHEAHAAERGEREYEQAAPSRALERKKRQRNQADADIWSGQANDDTLHFGLPKDDLVTTCQVEEHDSGAGYGEKYPQQVEERRKPARSRSRGRKHIQPG